MDELAGASPPLIVATSIWTSLQQRLGTVHESGEMGAFAGPPGIGKTTAIASFAESHPGRVARVLVRREGATQAAVMQAMLSAIRAAAKIDEHAMQCDTRRLEASLDRAIRRWEWSESGRGYSAKTNLTLIFDEAQNLSPKMIEMLRFWNDGTEDVPALGIVFSGNDQFRLDTTSEGPSFLSAAVVSRTGLNRRTWTYDDVSDDDVRRFAESRGVEDPTALDGLVAH